MDTEKKATIKDIAARCSVSLMTVSRVLNDKGGISKETARRVRQAARDLSYTPNLVAKSLRMKKTRTLGVVISDSSHLLFAKLLKGIGDAASAAGYSIIFANTSQQPEAEREAVEVLLSKRIDGLLLAAPLRTDAKTLKPVSRSGIPFTLLMRSGGPDADSVVNDNYRGARQLTAYLTETGSSDIRVISLPRESQSGKERLRGCRDELKSRGLRLAAGAVSHAAPQIEDGRRAMTELLRGGLRTGTIICGCDLIAIGAMQAAAGAGLAVPGDIRICGYDDIEMLDYLKVPLTTIRQPAHEMGRTGVRLLLDRISSPDRKAEHVVLPGELIVREST